MWRTTSVSPRFQHSQMLLQGRLKYAGEVDALFLSQGSLSPSGFLNQRAFVAIRC
jgi:hypothetical protein